MRTLLAFTALSVAGPAVAQDTEPEPTSQKVKFKEQVRECLLEGHAAIDEYALGLDSDDPTAVLELVAELTDDPWLKGKVWDRLSETTKHNVKTIIKENAQ